MFQSPFTIYSQNGEDVLLWRALKGVQRGFYIDVGAQDPINDSVTKAFYERGWHGINIEPVSRWYDRLVQDRPHDINLRLAVSDRPGTLKLFEVEDSGLSTSDPELAHRHEAEGYRLHEQAVECVTLDQICADHGVDTVHFLKIDCEGAEKSALEGISLSRVRPWIILIEATEPNSTNPTWHQWEHLLTARGYRFVFFDGLNRFYLADERADLAPAFEAPVNVFDSARRVSEVDALNQIDRLRDEIEGLKGATVVASLRTELATTVAERDAAVAGRDRAVAERDAVMIESDALRTRQSMLQREAAIRQAELNRLLAIQAALLSSHSWRITAPLRGCSRAARWGSRRLRRVIYLTLRPFAHMVRPTLRSLARYGWARRLATMVLGKNSRITQYSRLFLFGAAWSSRTRANTEYPPTGGREEPAKAGRDALAPGKPFDLDEVMERVRAEVAHRRTRC